MANKEDGDRAPRQEGAGAFCDGAADKAGEDWSFQHEGYSASYDASAAETSAPLLALASVDTASSLWQPAA